MQLSSTFDRETLLDLMVNIIPIGIMLFFGVVYIFIIQYQRAWGFTSLVMFALIIVPIVSLGLLTYISGKHISGGESSTETSFPPGKSTGPSARVVAEQRGSRSEEKE